MKPKIISHKMPVKPSEDEIRDYAYHLYTQSGCIPCRDQDNWLEAEACLCANIPKEQSHTRLHRHTRQKGTEITMLSSEARNLAA